MNQQSDSLKKNLQAAPTEVTELLAELAFESHRGPPAAKNRIRRVAWLHSSRVFGALALEPFALNPCKQAHQGRL